MTDLLDAALTPAQLSGRVEFYAYKPYNGGLTIDNADNLYTTVVGRRTVGIIPPDTRQYRDYVSDPNLIWPDGVTFNSDGHMQLRERRLGFHLGDEPPRINRYTVQR